MKYYYSVAEGKINIKYLFTSFQMFGVRQAVLASLPHVARGNQVRSIHVSRLAMAIQLKMPSLSPTMEEGTIVKWTKVYLLVVKDEVSNQCLG